MTDNFKERVCKISGEIWKQYNSLQKCQCDKCKNAFREGVLEKSKNAPIKPKNKPLDKRKPIKMVSDKRKSLNEIYAVVRIEVLSEAKFKCFVDNCGNVANTCEHQKGRKGYADDWARENNIPLLIDKRFLKPCCNFHNLEFERNPELAKQYQLSKIHEGKKL